MARDYHFYVYILTTYDNKVMYIGVTNSLERRIYEHCNGIVEGFTKNFMCENWFILNASRIFGTPLPEKSS